MNKKYLVDTASGIMIVLCIVAELLHISGTQHIVGLLCAILAQLMVRHDPS